MLAAAAAGSAVGAVEAIFGWRISRALGADDSDVTERAEITTAAAVTLVGAMFGALGGIVV